MADTPVRITHRLSDFTGTGYDKGRSLLWQIAWFGVQNLLFGAWWFPPQLRPLVLRAFGASVGAQVLIRHRVRVLWPWKLAIGDGSWIGEGVWLLDLEPIVVGTNVCISQEAFLCTGSHDHLSDTFEFDNGPITIADNAWIATQALVLRNVTIGPGALVGARAVVTRSVPAGETVPASSRY